MSEDRMPEDLRAQLRARLRAPEKPAEGKPRRKRKNSARAERRELEQRAWFYGDGRRRPRGKRLNLIQKPFKLTQEEVDVLLYLADILGCTQVDVVRQGIYMVDEYVKQQKENGKPIL